jgi:hypothetical protein
MGLGTPSKTALVAELGGGLVAGTGWPTRGKDNFPARADQNEPIPPNTEFAASRGPFLSTGDSEVPVSRGDKGNESCRS